MRRAIASSWRCGVTTVSADGSDGRPAAGRVPEFFVLGQPKSGTTALFEMLRTHPQIFMPARKEPRFFASEMYHRDPPRPGGTPKTLDEYLSWFEDARPNQRVGEASPWYLWSRAAAGRIADVQPAARLIAFVREPASLLRSLHLEFVQLYVEKETDFKKAMALEEPRRRGRHIPRYTYWPQMLQYAEHVRTTEQLRRYHAVFPREQMLTLIYDDFRDDNPTAVRRVLRFLDVDETLPVEMREANPTVRVRASRLHDALHSISVGTGPTSLALKEAIKSVTPRRLRHHLVRTTKERLLYADPEPVDEEFMLSLRRRFKPEVVRLSEYLGRDLVSLWGYDDLG